MDYDKQALYFGKESRRKRRIGPTIRKATFVVIGSASEAAVEPEVQKLVSAEEKLREIRSKRTLEDLVKGEMTSLQEGFIYLAGNPAWPDWLKVGMTIDYESRLATYNISDPLSAFQFLKVKWVEDRRRSESTLLELLGEHSEARRGEWFKTDPETALKIFSQL